MRRSEVTFWSTIFAIIALTVHTICLQLVFSVSHSRDSLVFYFPVVLSNLGIYMTTFPKYDPRLLFFFTFCSLFSSVFESFYPKFCISALNSVLLVLWFIYTEEYVFFFPFQQVCRILSNEQWRVFFFDILEKTNLPDHWNIS